MAVQIFQKWFLKWRSRMHRINAETDLETNNVVLKDGFSPMTYQNPFISCMNEILKQVIFKKNISYQRLELIIIDAEENRDQDMDDIQIVLEDLTQELNYLLIVTDRGDAYEEFAERMYEENGLIVQKTAKSACKGARGNLVLDFERSSELCAERMIHSETVYLPVYKKQWEISENLDIIVPVGYNTLVVDGIILSQMESISIPKGGRFKEDRINKIDRLDQEFRKG